MAGKDGDLLVDGAIMNNVPVDVMRAQCEAGPVVAVNLSAPGEREDPYAFGPWVSGWRVAWSRINPFSPAVRAPSILATMLRTTEVGSIHRMRSEQVLTLADVIINPDVQRFRRLDFRNHEELVRIGYESAVETLREWKRSTGSVPQVTPQQGRQTA